MKKTVLFSISSLGLGHATRTLAVIRTFLTTHYVHVICTGQALSHLRNELSSYDVTFHNVQDYPPLERGTGIMFYIYIAIDSLTTLRVIAKEHAFVEKLAREIHPKCIISDGRYGSYVKGIPSFIISHQISFVMPRGLSLFQRPADYLNYVTFKKFDAVLIPDYEEEDHNLAGKMSHHKMLEKLPHHYVGILSSLSHEQLPEDVDVLFSTGGFLSAHKPSFVESLIEQAKKIAGKKVFLLGKNGDDRAQPFAEHNIEIKSSVVGRARHELFNQSRIVVSRSGYTTIMDLVELQKPAILIPTPGQTEQEYLAEYLDSRRHFKASHHTNVYDRHMEEISYTPFLPPWKTKESVEKIRTIISLKINL